MNAFSENRRVQHILLSSLDLSYYKPMTIKDFVLLWLRGGPLPAETLVYNNNDNSNNSHNDRNDNNDNNDCYNTTNLYIWFIYKYGNIYSYIYEYILSKMYIWVFYITHMKCHVPLASSPFYSSSVIKATILLFLHSIWFAWSFFYHFFLVAFVLAMPLLHTKRMSAQLYTYVQYQYTCHI